MQGTTANPRLLVQEGNGLYTIPVALGTLLVLKEII